MDYFTKKKISSEAIAIIDVGSYKVRVGICEYEKESITLLSFAEKRQSNTDIVNNRIKNLEGICENIELAIKKAEKRAGLKIKKIIINPLFSDIFFYSKKISYQRKDSDKKIDEKELDKIITKIEKVSILSATKHIEKNFLYHLEDLDIIISNISEIKIDKTPISNPLSSRGNNIIFNILNIFIPKSNYEIINYIGSYLDKTIVKILPEEFCLAKIWEKNKDVVIINIGNSSSYITIKNKNLNILGSTKIEVGISNLIENIKRNCDFSRAEIIKKIDRSDFALKEKSEFLEIYCFLLLQGIKEIIGEKICPNNFFIVGGGGNNSFFKNYFEKIDFNSQGLKLTNKIKFIIPDIKKLGKIKNIEEVLCKSNLNIISMMLTFSKARNYKKDCVEKSLEKVIKKMISS